MLHIGAHIGARNTIPRLSMLFNLIMLLKVKGSGDEKALKGNREMLKSEEKALMVKWGGVKGN